MKAINYTPTKETGFADDDGRSIELGDTVELTFNEGGFNETKGTFTVIWDRGAFCIQSEQSTTPLRSISDAVKVRLI